MTDPTGNALLARIKDLEEQLAKRLTHEQALERLKQSISNAGSKAAWCRISGVSDGYLDDVLSGRTPSIGLSIYKFLKLKRIVMYEVGEDDLG